MDATSTKKITRHDVLGFKHVYRVFFFQDGSNRVEDWIYDADGIILATNEYKNVPDKNIENLFKI